jgi:hypothetical protein
VKLRVAHIVSELASLGPRTPAGLATLFLCRAQSARRLEVEVIAPRHPDHPPERHGLARRLTPLRVPVGDRTDEVAVHEGRLPDGATRVVLLEAPAELLAGAAVALLRADPRPPHVLHARPDTAGPLRRALAGAGWSVPVVPDLDGIPPGIDELAWDPARDAHLPARFSSADPDGKARCKLALQRELGLPPRARAPLIAVVAPLDPALWDVPTAEALVEGDMQLAMLGAPDHDGPAFERMRQLARRHWTRAAACAVANTDPAHDALTHRLIAGADFVLCAHPFPAEGPSDLHGLRYGTIPIAPADEGYRQALVELDPHTLTGTGVLFRPGDATALIGAVRRATRAYRESTAWPALVRRLMTMDLSWATAARRTEERYRAALRELSRSEGLGYGDGVPGIRGGSSLALVATLALSAGCAQGVRASNEGAHAAARESAGDAIQLATRAEAESAVGKVVSVSGTAEDAKLAGVVVRGDLIVYCLDRPSGWGARAGQPITVEGTLELTDELAAERAPDGSISAGTGGADLVLRVCTIR